MHKRTNKSIKPSATTPTYQTANTWKVKVAILICIFSLVTNNFDCFYTNKRSMRETSTSIAA